MLQPKIPADSQLALAMNHHLYLRRSSMFKAATLSFVRYSSSRPTIYALSTKLARSAIGVVRVSGPQSRHVLSTLTNNKPVPPPRLASVRKLYCPESKILLDEALVLYFKAPHSYTGEDLLELHLHGGTAIILSVIKAIGSLHDPANDVRIRYAENGEFSQRAFISGRFDLTEIEGIREMIDAETETQRIAALSSITGDTKNLFGNWREEIVKNVALLTTVIDFGEDHDIDEVAELFDVVNKNIGVLETEINQYLTKVRGSEILLKGIKLILLGPPNAGKSSLLNYLANKDAAIVSEIAGTTRDIIDVPLDIQGYKVVIGDTAGIRTGGDTIEVEGIRRAKQKSLGGDLVLVVLPANEDVLSQDLSDHVQILQREGKRIVVVLNKEDLVAAKPQALVNKFSQQLSLLPQAFHVVSCITGSGMEPLTSAIVSSFKEISLTDTADPIVISARVQDLLVNDVLQGFKDFRDWKQQDDVVLATESLKQAVDGIGKISGDAIGVEEILGVVFSSFCIGK